MGMGIFGIDLNRTDIGFCGSTKNMKSKTLPYAPEATHRKCLCFKIKRLLDSDA